MYMNVYMYVDTWNLPIIAHLYFQLNPKSTVKTVKILPTHTLLVFLSPYTIQFDKIR